MSKIRTIWTHCYQPFMMGGNVNSPIATKIGYIEEKAVGKGFYAFSFLTAKGEIRIAESITGAIVGNSFDEVRKDIKESKKKVMLQQIEEAKEHSKNVMHLSKEAFFERYRY